MNIEIYKKHLKKETEILKQEIFQNINNNNFDTALKNIIKLKSKQEILQELDYIF